MQTDILSEKELRITSVGIDIGSATSHLVFSSLTLEKRGNRFVTTGYETLFESPILLTPYVDGTVLDGERLAAFFQAQYVASGIAVDDVDTGALILTGAALLRENARGVAEAVGHAAGRLVAVSAGDALEGTMSAFGSGAVALSRETGARVLNIDVGGGTTKLAMCAGGRVEAVATLDVGARLVATDAAGAVTRLEETGRTAAQAIGLRLALGETVTESALIRLADFLGGQVLLASPLGQRNTGSTLLRAAALPADPRADLVTFSGGVAEYVYGRQAARFGDLGAPLAERLRRGVEDFGVTIAACGSGIRATVVGAGRHTAQVSGSTIYVSDPDVLPLREVPVVAARIDFGDGMSRVGVAAAVAESLARRGLDGQAGPVAIALDWDGTASYDRLDILASGIDSVLSTHLRDGAACVLVSNEDIAGLLGAHLHDEVVTSYPVVAVDCVELSDFDFIDLGRPLQRSSVMPIVIKSLVFPAPRTEAVGAAAAGLAARLAGRARSAM